jgi:hypothetical protein
MIGLLAGLAAAAAAPAAAPPSRDCSAPAVGARCEFDADARQRAAYGVRSIEEHQAAGDTVRRVFFSNAYGRDVVLVAFVRAAGHEPTLFVHFPKPKQGPAAAPLQAALSRETWERVIRASDLFDRQLAPLSPDPDANSICLDGWGYHIEAADPGPPGEPPAKVRKRRENACDGGLAGAFARDAIVIALPLLPSCAVLEGGGASRLQQCGLLKGDRLAAAEALNRAAPLRFGPEGGKDLSSIFDPTAAIHWSGEEVGGATAPARFWTEKMKAAGGNTFYPTEVEGLTAYRVRMRGELVGGAETEDGPKKRADTELIWTADVWSEFRITEARVGDFRLPPP